MKKVFLILMSVVNLTSLVTQAQEVTSCRNKGLVRMTEKILATGDVMATKNNETLAFSIGKYEIVSVFCHDDFWNLNRKDLKEIMAVRTTLWSQVEGSQIDPNGWNSGMVRMETEFEKIPADQFKNQRATGGETVTFTRLNNGHRVRKIEIKLDASYPTNFQLLSDYWNRDFLIPVSPFSISGKIKTPEVREISCALRRLKAKINLSKSGETLEAIVELKDIKFCP